MIAEQADCRAAEVLDTMSVVDLAEMFDATDKMAMNAEVATLRGWLMDALERRCPEQFAEWMENIGKTAREAFNA